MPGALYSSTVVVKLKKLEQCKAFSGAWVLLGVLFSAETETVFRLLVASALTSPTATQILTHDSNPNQRWS